MMDPDLVRQQEEAERVAAGLAPKKNVDSSGQLTSAQDAPDVPVAAPSPAVKKAVESNRRALPPMGTGRRPGEAAPPRKRIHGLLRLFLYALGGAVVGGIAGFIGTTYFDLFKDHRELSIAYSAGGFAVLFGLTHLLYYDH